MFVWQIGAMFDNGFMGRFNSACTGKHEQLLELMLAFLNTDEARCKDLNEFPEPKRLWMAWPGI